MWLLLLVSCIWAASFSLIKTFLGSVPPDTINASRLGLMLLVFLPFLRRRELAWRTVGALMAVGALQFGAMGVFYTRSFAFLKAHEVALATVMTPIYVVLLQGLLQRQFSPLHAISAALSVMGTAISLGVGSGALGAPLAGLLLVQASNLCFALGQVWYRRLMADHPALPNRQAFAWLALGGVAVAASAGLPVLIHQGFPPLTTLQALVLLYLGLVASGLCFFLWNTGARQVNTGVLAVMNDLKIPLAIAVAVLVFGERAAIPRLLAGGSLVLLAWWLSARSGFRSVW